MAVYLNEFWLSLHFHSLLLAFYWNLILFVGVVGSPPSVFLLPSTFAGKLALSNMGAASSESFLPMSCL